MADCVGGWAGGRRREGEMLVPGGDLDLELELERELVRQRVMMSTALVGQRARAWLGNGVGNTPPPRPQSTTPCRAQYPRPSCFWATCRIAHKARRCASWAGMSCLVYLYMQTLLTVRSVDEYVVATATLHLKHAYPASDPPKVAHVNIDHVLQVIKHTEMEVGAWINVIGYVERRKEKGIFVQAIVVWSAGNVDLDAYEKAAVARKKAK